MAEFRLDRIRFRWKDIWAITTQYIKDDIVIYEGKTYVALQTHTAGTNFYDDFDNSYWELMFDGRRYKHDWEASTLENTVYYSVGDIVKWKGYIYRCIVPHSSTIVSLLGPVSVPDNWTIFATTYNWLSEWQLDTSYDLGDVVKENGITYICIEKHLSNNEAFDGITPDLDQNYWAIVTRSDDWQNVWQTSYRYEIDDVVKYGGKLYRCVNGHTSTNNAELGLEINLSDWNIVFDSIEYKGIWQSSFRYKQNDIVKYGHTLYICTTHHTSTTTLREDESNWSVYVPGLGFEEVWDSEIEYQKGDIVLYGGYAYTALTNNVNSVPSVNGLLQDTNDWELLKQGYRHLGEWDSLEQYLTGDVIRHFGRLYICITDSISEYPDVSAKWQMLVEGDHWQGDWISGYEYAIGDVVTDASISYVCILRHDSSQANRPSVDIAGAGTYWEELIKSTSTNVLTNLGDIRTFDTATNRLPIGDPGQVLKVNASNLTEWLQYEEVPKVFYVSNEGVDDPNAGTTINAPFKTVRYACDHILADQENRAPATVFIKTGYYEEELPIKVPADVALVGDELRSTVIAPSPSDVTTDMFYVRNGSGIRNMTLQGLTGTLGDAGTYGTFRPTAGAYVGLDPGDGPDDSSVHIINKSPYIQNVTTFGTGCVGMKIDGSLHNSGNRSIVANDFTQVLDDGIGYWATENARSELVSVFTYFCYIGYLAENGGILRATNGNNSYGTYGSRAEGVDPSETPKQAFINNRDNDAQIEVLHNNGSNLIAAGYSNAGQNYSSATITVDGSGTGAELVYEEYRDSAVNKLRVLGPSDSSIPGGLNYQYLLNTAQGGTSSSITLSGADLNEDAALYVGQRITIVAGKGVGQYGIISSYDPIGKEAIISKEYNNTAGWESLYPGRPIETELNSTTRYSLEPRVIIDDPGWTESTNTLSWPGTFASSSSILSMAYVDGTYIAVNENGDSAISTNGTSFVSNVSDITGTGFFNNYPKMVTTYNTSAYFLYQNNNTVYRYNTNSNSWSSIGLSANQYVVMAVNTDTGDHIAIDGNASLWQTFNENGGNLSVNSFSTIGGGAVTTGIAYGNSIWVVIKQDGAGAYSTDNGNSWTESLTLLPIGNRWDDLTYGNGRFVAVGRSTGSGEVKAAYSFDGITWYNDDGHLSNLPSVSDFIRVVYQNGQFLAWPDTTGTQVIARSKDGYTWKFFDEDSTQFTIQSPVEGVYALDNELWNWNRSSNDVYKYASGAGAFARAHVEGSRISQLVIYDPGANYSGEPNIEIFDNQATSNALIDVVIRNGVLPQPLYKNRGAGYVRSSATISGNGFAEIYQLGKELKVTNLDILPGPGANITIDEIADVTYSLSAIKDISGASPNYSATLEITPSLKENESPDHNTEISIRERYSQVRLTGHDFLDIGSGNVNSTRYPNLYVDGVDSLNEPQQQQEVTFVDGGRVFYTSTDQDGNFRVGELFEVEQATGIVSVNADQFDLTGLTELALGGIVVGGSQVVIQEFSKESTFVANSNNIVPTQRAIISYLESRISSGGANAITNKLVAGQVQVGSSNTLTTTSGLEINVPPKVTIKGGAGGHYLATMYYTFGSMVQ